RLRRRALHRHVAQRDCAFARRLGRTRSRRMDQAARKIGSIRSGRRALHRCRARRRRDLPPMRVLMTTDTLGGVWTYALTLAAGIVARGGEVVLVTAGRPLSLAQRLSLEPLHRVQLFETHYRLEWMHDAWDDVDAMGEALLGIEKLERPDVVHLNDYSHGNLPWRAPVLVA